MSDWWNRPLEPSGKASETAAIEEQADQQPGQQPEAVCPWCSARPGPGDTHCPGCGAALAQHENLGGMVIPGVTDVDPSMRPGSYTGTVIRGQASASTLNMVGRFGGAGAQMAVAAGMLARDGLKGMFETPESADDLGKPSQAALDMAARLHGGQGPATTTGPEEASGGQDGADDPSFWEPTGGNPADEAQASGHDDRSPS
jgi:hypothetical protein